MSPVSIAFGSAVEKSLGSVSSAYASKLPPVSASYTPAYVTVPHDAVAVGNSIAEPVVASVGVVPLTVNAAVWRAYDPPDTSVPAALSLDADVCKPTYNVVGAVYAVPPNTWSRILSSR